MKRFFAIVALSYMTVMPATAIDIIDKSSVVPRGPDGRGPDGRFIFVSNTGNTFPHCSLRIDPRMNAKSPWVSELMQKMELTTTGEVRAKDGSGCAFDLNPEGQIINLRSYPGISSDEQNTAMQVVRQISALKPLKGELADHNSVTISIQFQSWPNYIMRQYLTPIK